MTMKVPEWAGELKDKMVELHKKVDLEATPIGVKNLYVVEDFSTLFGEFEVRNDDVLVHLFPRAGPSDQWVAGRYIGRCKSCKRDVPVPKRAQDLKACPGCGHVGLVYIPGRQEEKVSCAFPGNMKDIISKAIDRTWMGDTAVDYVVELGAYVVQFQYAKTAAELVGVVQFVDRFCEEVDTLLDGVRTEH